MFKFRYWAATRVCILESFLGIYVYFQTEGCTLHEQQNEWDGFKEEKRSELSLEYIA